MRREKRTMKSKKKGLCFCVIVLLFAACELGDNKLPTYTIEYNANGGEGEMENSVHVYGKAKDLNANTFTREGFAFTGWATTPEGEIAYTDGQSVRNLTQEAGAVITLYAVWGGISYTVVYNANGGTGSMENSVFTYGVEQNLRENTFTYAGHAFIGWATSASGEVEYTNQQSVNNLTAVSGVTITLYAVWNANAYTVVYDANGGAGDMADSIFLVGVSQGLRSNTFTRTGYTFTGWATSDSGDVIYTEGQNVNNLTTTVGATVTLYAVWAGNAYTVVYNANGGSGSMANSNFIYGVPQNLRANTFTSTIDNYVFAGWATSDSGTAVYTNEQEVGNLATEENATVTLYAVWQPTNVPGATLAAKLSWLQTNAVSGVSYTVEVSANESISPANLSYSGRNNITITLRGIGTERTISLSSNGSLFTISNGVTLVLDNNITLQGRDRNNASLVRVNSGGALLMNTGSLITGNTRSTTSNSAGGGVSVDGGTFNMNGGTISGNTASAAITSNNSNNSPRSYSYGGGVYMGNGTFTMNGGTISGNTATSSAYNYPISYSYGGGVYMGNGTFTMNGGTISDNTTATSFSNSYTLNFGSSNSSGGGVSVGGGTFNMNEGTISDNTATSDREVYGGGVYISDGTFTMEGGTISGNTASSSSSGSSDYGGGVYVNNTAAFTKTSGTIYGYTEGDDNSNVVRQSNGTVRNDRGHAVYAGVGSSVKRKETTAGPSVNLWFDRGSSWGGDWDF